MSMSKHYDRSDIPNGILTGDLTITGNYLLSKKVGSFTRDISLASGTQAITGVTFKPSAIMFFGTIAAQWATVWGISDVSTNVLIRTQNGSVVFERSTTQCLLFEVAGGFASAVVTSFDTDGFTLTWTKNTTPTGTATITYIAFR